MKKLLELIREIRKCQLCKLKRNPLGVCVSPVGQTIHPELMIIGQSPGKTEAEEGVPFCGPSGELLDFMLDEIPIRRSECYITNTVKCFPPFNRALEMIEVINCRPYLIKEIKWVRPKVCLFLGRDAYSLVSARLPFSHGSFVKTKPRIVVGLHPAYFLRRNNSDAFIQIAEVIRGLL